MSAAVTAWKALSHEAIQGYSHLSGMIRTSRASTRPAHSGATPLVPSQR